MVFPASGRNSDSSLMTDRTDVFADDSPAYLMKVFPPLRNWSRRAAAVGVPGCGSRCGSGGGCGGGCGGGGGQSPLSPDSNCERIRTMVRALRSPRSDSGGAGVDMGHLPADAEIWRAGAGGGEVGGLAGAGAADGFGGRGLEGGGGGGGGEGKGGAAAGGTRCGSNCWWSLDTEHTDSVSSLARACAVGAMWMAGAGILWHRPGFLAGAGGLGRVARGWPRPILQQTGSSNELCLTRNKPRTQLNSPLCSAHPAAAVAARRAPDSSTGGSGGPRRTTSGPTPSRGSTDLLVLSASSSSSWGSVLARKMSRLGRRSCHARRRRSASCCLDMLAPMSLEGSTGALAAAGRAEGHRFATSSLGLAGAGALAGAAGVGDAAHARRTGRGRMGLALDLQQNGIHGARRAAERRGMPAGRTATAHSAHRLEACCGLTCGAGGRRMRGGLCGPRMAAENSVPPACMPTSRPTRPSWP